MNNLTSQDTIWFKWPNFSHAEIACQETGNCCIDPSAMDKLQKIRERFGRPMKISSGYRDPTHSIEAKKTTPGFHAQGVAFDIACYGEDAFDLLSLLNDYGVKGIGIQQKGPAGGRFIHIDFREGPPQCGVINVTFCSRHTDRSYRCPSFSDETN